MCSFQANFCANIFCEGINAAVCIGKKTFVVYCKVLCLFYSLERSSISIHELYITLNLK